MAHCPLQDQDDDIPNEGSDSDPTTNEGSEASDAEAILSALRIPAADADIAELRKVSLTWDLSTDTSLIEQAGALTMSKGPDQHPQ